MNEATTTGSDGRRVTCVRDHPSGPGCDCHKYGKDDTNCFYRTEYEEPEAEVIQLHPAGGNLVELHRGKVHPIQRVNQRQTLAEFVPVSGPDIFCDDGPSWGPRGILGGRSERRGVSFVLAAWMAAVGHTVRLWPRLSAAQHLRRMK